MTSNCFFFRLSTFTFGDSLDMEKMIYLYKMNRLFSIQKSMKYYFLKMGSKVESSKKTM